MVQRSDMVDDRYEALTEELRGAEGVLNEAMTMAACPYYLTGDSPCLSGCWQEPRCITEEPAYGWSGQSVGPWVRDLLKDARGNHKLVKRARDLMRRAEKAIERELAS